MQHLNHETHGAYLWTIATDGAVRIVHGKDADAYKVQRHKGAGRWRLVETCETRAQLLCVVRSMGDTFDDGGPLVRSDLLRAVAELLPACASDFRGDGSGVVAEARSRLEAASPQRQGRAERPKPARRRAVRAAERPSGGSEGVVAREGQSAAQRRKNGGS